MTNEPNILQIICNDSMHVPVYDNLLFQKQIQTDWDRDIKPSETIALVDFLNLIRATISNRPDAKFETINEFICHTKLIAQQIRGMGDFNKIYIVTKSFKFNDDILYNDLLRIILWSFFNAVPEWVNKICLVLVNGINSKDKEADDRTLFILYNEFIKTTNMRTIIISNDNFKNLKTHILKRITLNFYWIGCIKTSWRNSEIISRYKGIFRQNDGTEKNSYIIVHPDNKKINIFNIAF